MGADAPFQHDPSWSVVSLAEIATKIGSGATPSGGADAYLPSRDHFALVRSQNVFDRHFNRTGLAYITDEQADGLRGVVLQPDDILLNITGDGITFGRACLAPADVLPACVNQHVSIIRLDARRADPAYVLAYLTHPEVKSYIESFNAGGSRRAITKGHIESFRLPLPTIDQQRRIGQILGALDDKIELNRRMNETLEAIARTLFKSWFVDFDPVRAKEEARDPGLPKMIADLFPDRLVDSDLGPIPEGWVAARWGDLITLEYGRGLRDYGNSTGRYPVFGTNGKIGTWDEALCTHPGIVIGRKGAYRGVHFSPTPFYVIDTAFYVEPLSTITLRWAYYEILRRDLNAMDSGSAIPSTSRDEFYGVRVVTPPAAVQEAFTRLLAACWSRQDQMAEESRTLGAVRDGLLPRLVTGDLRVSHPENVLGALPS